MSNLALYRKYRSADFDEVVGQQHVVKTLTNAINNGKHSHAYLLTGPRGVGKTTIARIIAKQINGLKKEDSLDNYLDIIEIDGASNRGIDEIRSLREKVQVSPAKLNYKVYIIDEVHMLTKEAFNALLKTLEEPPEHVVFVFATTEVHKLPETIISRTQRFDFRPISSKDMVNHLRFIADKESIDINDDALNLIAQISKGGFRDAISLLDQMASLDEEITTEVVADFTGLQDSGRIAKIINMIKNNEKSNAISAIDSLFMDGADPSKLNQQILDYIQQEILLDDSDHDFLIVLAEDLHWAQANMRYSSSPELVLQVGLVRSLVKKDNLNNAPKELKQNIKNNKVTPHNKNKIIKNNSTADNKSDDLLIKSLSVIKHYNNSLFAVLKGSELRVEGDEIIIKCRFSFHKDRILEQRNNSLIEKAFSKVYGESMHISISVENMDRPKQIDPAEEVVKSAAAIFGAEVTDA